MRKIYSCRDRLCGAEDCRNCHPANIASEDSGAEVKADDVQQERLDNED